MANLGANSTNLFFSRPLLTESYSNLSEFVKISLARDIATVICFLRCSLGKSFVPGWPWIKCLLVYSVGLKKFIEFLQSDCPVAEADKKMGDNGKKLEIRAFPSRNIHAKVCICRGKKVILGPITNKMTDEEKFAVIQRQFDRLYDPRHPVRNHLETLDSVEVVRTIREALKR